MSEKMLEQTVCYKVVLNSEEQYSLWPAETENPPGWFDAGIRGSREACLAFITQVWSDLRPLSLRHSMQERLLQLEKDSLL
jgi:MbtH protein